MSSYDFSGYATKANIRCTDGRRIMPDAFKEMNGKTVPLVWMHSYDDPDNVLGKVRLEHRDDGVYAYGEFNDTEKAQQAKALLQHGDLSSMSINANHLKQRGSDVLHGAIREVSLVLAGANPGALIEDVAFTHGDGNGNEIVASFMEPFDNTEPFDMQLSHDDSGKQESVADNSEEETVQDIVDTMNDKQRNVLDYLIGKALESKEDEDAGEKPPAAKDDQDESTDIKHSDDPSESDDSGADEDSEESDETIKDIVDSMSEKQKNVLYFLIQKAVEGQNGSDADTNDEGDQTMKHNAFEDQQGSGMIDPDAANSLLHSAINDRARNSSLRDSLLNQMESAQVLMHADGDTNGVADTDYGIGEIDLLFPDARNVANAPEFIKRRTEWVETFMNGLHKSPFSRIKSMTADITADEARARGYLTGHRKVEEVFSLAKRETTPQTVYKKQKLDRDNVIDITDFDVVAWMKSEMQGMLREEVARAVLVGDGRSSGAEDKIGEDHIRPVWTDDELFAIHVSIEGVTDPLKIDDETGRKIVRQIVASLDDYEGKGTPNLYASAKLVTALLLLEDGMGRRLYNNMTDLASALGVASVVKVPIMRGLSRTVTGSEGALAAGNYNLLGILLNPADYTMGADKGGETTYFEDFDIDFNQMKYLYETRVSGALTAPKTAVVLEAPKA